MVFFFFFATSAWLLYRMINGWTPPQNRKLLQEIRYFLLHKRKETKEKWSVRSVNMWRQRIRSYTVNYFNYYVIIIHSPVVEYISGRLNMLIVFVSSQLNHQPRCEICVNNAEQTAGKLDRTMEAYDHELKKKQQKKQVKICKKLSIKDALKLQLHQSSTRIQIWQTNRNELFHMLQSVQSC